MRLRADDKNISITHNLLLNEKKKQYSNKAARDKWERNADKIIGERQSRSENEQKKLHKMH